MAKVITVEWKPGETVFGGGKGVSKWRPYRDKQTGRSLVNTTDQEDTPPSCELSLINWHREQSQKQSVNVDTANNQVQVECILSASNSYIETLAISQISLQPGLTELVLRTQLLTAKNSQEQRVKAQCFVERAQLIGVRDALNKFLGDKNTKGETP